LAQGLCGTEEVGVDVTLAKTELVSRPAALCEWSGGEQAHLFFVNKTEASTSPVL